MATPLKASLRSLRRTLLQRRIHVNGTAPASRVNGVEPTVRPAVSIQSAPGVGTVGVLGCGKMAEAICRGMVESKVVASDQLQLYDVNQKRIDHFHNQGIVGRVCEAAAEVAEGADTVLLAVKPQHMQKALAAMAPGLSPETMVVSIAAGLPVSLLAEELPGCSAIVRAMPNTPAMIGEGMTVWYCSDGVTKHQQSQARSMIACFGSEHLVAEEHFLDIATAVVGSGPAYTFMFIEAQIDTAVHMGFPRDVAEKLVIETVRGSTEYLAQTEKHIAALRNDITSPGGTTAAAIYSAEQGGFKTVISDSLWASFRRSLELGGNNSDVGPGRSLNHQFTFRGK